MADVVVTGSYNQDLVFRTRQFPAPGETRLGTFDSGPGGKGFNQAVASARQGVDTLFIGATGNDDFAVAAERFAQANGLECALERIDGAPTGCAGIVVDDRAENQIVVAAGANSALSTSHIDALQHRIASARVLLAQLECNIDAVAHALRTARNAGVTTILNPAPVPDHFDQALLSDVDILVPNQSELASIAGVDPQRCADPDDESGLRALCTAVPVPVVVVTLGAGGALICSEQIDASDRIRPVAVQPVDTTGAGDAFSGALAARLAELGPGSLLEACRWANAVAGLSTESPGAATAMPAADAAATRFELAR